MIMQKNIPKARKNRNVCNIFFLNFFNCHSLSRVKRKSSFTRNGEKRQNCTLHHTGDPKYTLSQHAFRLQTTD